MTRKILLGALLALTLAPAVAGAQEALEQQFGALYASVKLGVALPGTVNIDASASNVNGFPPFTGTLDFSAGPAFTGAFGAHFTENLRGEISVGVANNTARSYVFSDGRSGNATGSITTISATAVGYYDFTNFGGFVPYLSAGLGVVNVSTNDLVVQANTDGTTRGSSLVPALRIGAGFSYEVATNVDIGLDYYALIGTRNTMTFSDPIGGPGVAPFTRTITSDTLGHALSASIKIKF